MSVGAVQLAAMAALPPIASSADSSPRCYCAKWAVAAGAGGGDRRCRDGQGGY